MQTQDYSKATRLTRHHWLADRPVQAAPCYWPVILRLHGERERIKGDPSRSCGLVRAYPWSYRLTLALAEAFQHTTAA